MFTNYESHTVYQQFQQKNVCCQNSWRHYVHNTGKQPEHTLHHHQPIEGYRNISGLLKSEQHGTGVILF